MQCRIARASEWAVRLTQHLETVGSGVFVTLTYNDEHLPADGGLHKRDVQLWIKRLRKLSGLKLKYYACGEYGETGGRPHYHAIVFGLRLCKETAELITKTWTVGYNKLGTVTYDSCRYVSEYISKGLMGGMTIKQLQLDKREPPFALMSQGIGAEYVKRHEADLLMNLSTRLRGKQVGLPRYYRKVLGLETADLAPAALEKQLKQYETLVRRCHGNLDAVYPRVISGKRQAAKNVIAAKAVKAARDPESKH